MRRRMNKEYREGTKIEYEHKPTLRRIKRYFYKNKRFPSIRYVAHSIANDHIKEFPRKRYYTNEEYGLKHFEHELKESRRKHAKEKRKDRNKMRKHKRIGRCC